MKNFRKQLRFWLCTMEGRCYLVLLGCFYVSFLFCAKVGAQSVITADGLASFGTNAPVSGGGGGTSFALVASTGKDNSGNGAGDVTTAAINTSGASLIVVAVGQFANNTTDPVVTDNQGNTYTALTHYWPTGVDRNGIQIFYVLNPTTGASHTFSVATSANYGAVTVLAFSGGTPAFENQNGNNANWVGTTIQPGSITPAGDNELFVTAATVGASSTISAIDSSFTLQATGKSDGTLIKIAYKIQTSGSPENPQFTSSSDNGAAAMAAFK